PLNEYKTEAFAMFELMLLHLRESVTQTLSLIDMTTPEGAQSVLMGPKTDPSKIKETRTDPALMGAGLGTPQPEQQPARIIRASFDQSDPATWNNVSRNAPCPCGSGKKFKYCHGKVGE
ncbi:MAG TPA: SEC-C metal-binding domain-containing protein, partial [Micavibrio sp.]